MKSLNKISKHNLTHSITTIQFIDLAFQNLIVLKTTRWH